MASNATENTGSDAEQDDSGEQTEVADAEVIDNTSAPSEVVQFHATFTATDGPLNLKVLPSIERGGTDWRIVIYSQGVRGSLLETNQPLTDAQAAELGISRQLQERVNGALEYAQAHLELPRELGHMSRSKRTLSDLEGLME